MKQQLLKIELVRAFKNRKTCLALFIGCMISVFHVFHNLAGKAAILNEMAHNLKGMLQYPVHLFSQWMCGNTSNMEGFLYFMIFPLLAVLPHSMSFLSDKENGYIRQMYIRCNRTEYLAAKYISLFLVGGTVVAFPLLLNFCICATLMPALKPQNVAGTFVNASVLWYSLYENVPLAYVLLFLMLIFAFAGLVATLPLFFSHFSDKRFIVLLMPFVIQVFFYSVCMMTGNPESVHYTPVYFLFPAMGCPSAWLLTGYAVVYFGMGGLAYWRMGKTEDIF